MEKNGDYMGWDGGIVLEETMDKWYQTDPDLVQLMADSVHIFLPFLVAIQVPRSGQRGYHHRTEINKKIYRIGKNLKEQHMGLSENRVYSQ